MFQNAQTLVQPPVHNNRPRIVLGLLILFCLISLSLTLYLGYQFYQASRVQRSASLEVATENAAKSSHKIEQELARLQMLADRIARELSTGSLRYEQIPNRLEDELRNYQDIFGLGVAFEHGIYDPDQLYAPYLFQKESGFISERIRMMNLN